jgi:multiple sugar transport system ATP-binding protein
MASVELRNVSKSFGKVEAVCDVSLQIADRELLVFLGPSGCGKSTLLRLIAGLETITSGELLIGGRPMNRVAAADRGIAMVFQSYALYPHMTVAENMGFVLKMTGVPAPEVARKVAEVADTLQLSELLRRKPRELSGGQRQRVAIGRAIVREPAVFLFDEPLSNLDADLRAQMRVELAGLHDRLQTTMIYVTHDQVEAMTLADRIVILNHGRIEQQGAPLELYANPANRFVAGFLGQPKMNFLPVVVAADGDGVALRLAPDGPVVVQRPPVDGLAVGDTIEVGIRPNEISLVEAGNFAGEVVLVEHLGATSLMHVRVPGLPRLLTIEQSGRSLPAAGSRIGLHVTPDAIHLFNQAGQAYRT